VFIKKDKKSLFSIPVFSFFNKRFFSIILKFFGIIQIIVLVFFVYMAIALEKEEIKGLIHSVAQQTYWFGKMLTSLPIKWSNNISSDHPILNIEIAPKNYQLLMTMRDDAIKKAIALKEHKKYVPGVINYKNDKFDIRIRLKGDVSISHFEDSKWSMRITLNNDRFMDMKTFSLQDPRRRSYMASFMLHKFTENEKLITKKFNLIPVSINGKYMGIYNYEEVPDHDMMERLTGINNIVVMVDDDDMFEDAQLVNQKNERHFSDVSDFYFSSVIKAHSFNDILNDKILKKDFERASKLLNGLRGGTLTASEVFDLDRTSLWLALTDLFGAYHGVCTGNIKLIYDRDLDRLYPIVWDAFSENVWSSIAFHEYNMFKLSWMFNIMIRLCCSRIEMLAQMLLDQNLVEKYLTKLDEITSPEYIDNVMKNIRPQVDEYMNILNLEYPQLKIEDELKRLKENAEYLRNVYLYPELPFNAYLSKDEPQNSLILVNRKPVPIKILSLIDSTTDQVFNVSEEYTDFILENNIPGVPAAPIKVYFECPARDCFSKRKIENLRVKAKVVGTSKSTSIKINNWSAYAQ
jgi:hypothetical protein